MAGTSELISSVDDAPRFVQLTGTMLSSQSASPPPPSLPLPPRTPMQAKTLNAVNPPQRPPPDHKPDVQAEKDERWQLALLGCIDGIGRRTLRKIQAQRAQFGWSWREVWQPSEVVLAQLSLNRRAFQSIKNANYEQLSFRLERALAHHQARLIAAADPEYPPLLKEADDAPVVLFAKGAPLDWQALGEPVAVVGARNVTAYGRYVTEKITTELAQLGIAVVSGLMYGVDSVAHLAALRAGGRTIALLGYGFDHCYPPEHQPVLAQLLSMGATLLSEYPPWQTARKGNFPARNSIVAAMCAVVVVTEAGLESGSMITARLANEEGRAVCAVPGPINNPYCEGTRFLLNQGAMLVASGSEVLEQVFRPSGGVRQQSLGEVLKERRRFGRPRSSRPPPSRLSELGRRIMALLDHAPADLELLQRATAVEQAVLLGELTTLELQLVIRRDGSGWARC